MPRFVVSGHEIRDRHAVQGHRVDRRSAGKGVPDHDVLDPTDLDIDLGGVPVACVGGGHVHRSLIPEADVTPGD